MINFTRLFSKLLPLGLLFCAFSASAQSTIASEGFNGSQSLFTISGTTGSFYSGNSASGDRPQSSPFFIEGTGAYGLNATSSTNVTSILTTSSAVNTSSYTGVQMSFRLSAWSIASTGNGMETSDKVVVEVSADDGSTWAPTIEITGGGNTNWNFATGTNASTAYDGNPTAVSFQSGPTTYYSTVTITGLPSVSGLRVRISMNNNATAERWIIDDFKITGTLADNVDGGYIASMTPSTIGSGSNTTVVAGAFEPGVTNSAGQGAGITVEVGYSASNTNPSSGGWTWTSASYSADSGNDDLYTATFGSSLAVGTYYVAARFKKGSSNYIYGGTSGTAWNNNSAVLTVNAVTAPDINVVGNGNSIADGDTTPSIADLTDFGSADITVPESAPRMFTIQNTGNASLTISDFTITGPGADMWFINLPPDSPVADGSNTSFEIEFFPTAAGTHTATVTILSNDPDEGTYTFDIVGVGTENAPFNDECGITGGADVITPTNIFSGTLDQATSTLPFATNDVWYKFTAGCGSTAVVSVTTSSQDVDLQIWSGNCPVSTSGAIASATGTSLTGESVSFTAVNGMTYRIRVSHKSTTSGSVAGPFDIVVNYITSVTLAASANPAAGNIATGASNVNLLGFTLTPSGSCASYNFTGASIATSGTATASDLSNFRLVYDANNNSVPDAGEISSPVGTVATLSNPLTFTVTGQSNIIAARRYFLIANVATGAVPARAITASLAAANVTSNVFVSGSVAGNAQTIQGTAPVLTAASDATVDAPFTVTFTDDAIWRGNVTGVTVNGTPLTAGYTVTAGQITFTPSASVPANLLQVSGSKNIAIIASGYNNATVTQTVGHGAATNLLMVTQPVGPANNGGVLATSPVVRIADQYNNTVTSASNSITASVGSGAWTIGGTTSATAGSGSATFSGITASSSAAVAGATIAFASPGLAGVTSGAFSITAPDFISLVALGTSASENFNTLATSGTSATLPQGWTFSEVTDGSYTANDGSSNSGNTYSYGTGTNTDRAFGMLRSGSNSSTIGAKFRNDTGAAITAINVSYTGEQWRLGTTGRVDRMEFEYSTTATSVGGTGFTPATSANFTAPVTSGTTGALNGNSAANRAAVTATIGGLNIPNGATFWIRYVDFDASGSDDGLAIDDFSLTPCATATASIVSNNGPVCSGSNAVFTLTGTPNATVTYTINGGSSQNATLDGSGAATITINGATAAQTLALVSASNENCSFALTGTSTINITPLANAGTASANQSICAGAQPAAVSLTGSVGSIQWQISTDGVQFDNIDGQTAATLSGAVIGTLNATRYVRAIVTSGSCGSATSSVVTITVDPVVTPTFTAFATICAGDVAPVLPSSSLENITGTWTPSTVSNTTSGTYTFTPDGGQCANTVNISVTVNEAPVGGTLSGSTTTCAPASATLLLTGYSGTIVKWQSSATSDFSAGVTDIANTSDSYSASNLTSSTYYRAVLGNGVCADLHSDVASVIINNNIWTGANGSSWTDSGNWSCGVVPASLTDVTVADVTNKPIIASDVHINTLTVDANAQLTLTSGFDLTVTNAINVATGGVVTIQNNANLLQINDVSNTGNITVKRNTSALKRLDYTLWSSPVAGQNLFAFSPLTSMSPSSRFYVYNTSTNLYASIATPSAVTFEPAKGYLIRVPNNHPTWATIWPGSFTGVPHNGTINFTMVDDGPGKRYNLVGNPYPSPISISDFVFANSQNITGTLYFWRKTNNALSPSYCQWTAGTFVSNQEAQVFDPQGIIRTGQGFFVEGTGAGTTLTFDNSMRVGDNANQFFRLANVEKHRIWINARSAEGAFSQTAIVYVDGASSEGVDMFDGRYNNDGLISLASTIGGEAYTIQGRAPFAPSDVVPLQFSAATAGSFSIELDHVDGLFEGDQQIYLRDLLAGSLTNLKQGPYEFTSDAGTIANRFEVVYDGALSVEAPQTSADVVVISEGNDIRVLAAGRSISKLMVYDVRGRLLDEETNVGASQATLHVGAAQQMLLVKTVFDDGSVSVVKTMK